MTDEAGVVDKRQEYSAAAADNQIAALRYLHAVDTAVTEEVAAAEADDTLAACS